MTDMTENCTPRLRFPEFQDAGEWENCYIKDIADVLSGYVFPNKYQGKRSGDYPFYKVSDISSAQKNGIYINCASNYIDTEILRAIKAKLIPKYTIIFAKIGEAIKLNRRSITMCSSVIDNNIAGIKLKNENIFYLFLYYMISKLDFNEYIDIGAVPAINKSTIEKIQIKITILTEQQKIAECLSSLDELIEAHEQKCEALKQHKKGLMQRLFPAEGEATPRWRFPEFRDAGEWLTSPLEDIATFYNGRAYKQEELLNNGKYKVLRVGNLFNSDKWYYSNLELEEDKYCDKNNLLYAWSASFGPFIWNFEKVIYHYHIWKVVSQKNTSTKFLYYILDIETAKIKKNTLNGLGIMHITKCSIERWQCKIPSFPEQQKIADCLSSLDERIEAQEAKTAALREHKKGLMQQLFPRCL